MSVLFSPWGNQQFFDENGDPATGWKIYTYAAGSSTPLATYTDSGGLTAQTNPIVINSLGFPTTGQVWLTSGLSYKLVLTDENDVVKKTEDNITGVTGSASVSQWQASGLTPTYVGATSFTLAGDQTSEFHVGRRLQSTNTAGTIYSYISATAYTTLTTVTVVNDSGVLDSGLSAVSYGLLTATNPSVPTTYAKSGANIDIASRGNNTSTIYTTAGTSTAYTLTPVPAITAYAAGQSFFVNFNAASGAAPTITINGVATPPNLVKQLADGTYANLAADDITADHRSRVTLISATQALVERTAKRQYELVFQSSTSYGSDASNKIKRYANTLVNQGGDAMTATDSATAGLSVTINIAGKYAVGIDATGATTSLAGVSVNSNQLTTSIFTITASHRVGVGTGVASNNSTFSRIRYFAVGDVVRPHADGTAAQTSAVEQFSIIKVD